MSQISVLPHNVSFAHWPSFCLVLIVHWPGIGTSATASILANRVASAGHASNLTGGITTPGIEGVISWPVQHCSARAEMKSICEM